MCARVLRVYVLYVTDILKVYFSFGGGGINYSMNYVRGLGNYLRKSNYTCTSHETPKKKNNNNNPLRITIIKY